VFLMLVHDAFIVDIQKAYYHTEQFVQWLDLMLKGLKGWISSLSYHFITQIGTDLWLLFHPMKYHKSIIEILMHIL
jgi:hypothetical protein